jgi:hypothetical protein
MKLKGKVIPGPDHREQKQEFSCTICAIMKDENDYVKEWAAYHSIIGVEHFFIYDDDSVKPLRETLAGWEDIVTVLNASEVEPGEEVLNWGNRGTKHEITQCACYNDCLQRFGNTSKWMAFIDADEFICLNKHNTVREFLEDYDEFDAVLLNWKTFGSSGHYKKPQGLVIENYTRCRKLDTCIKTIVKPSSNPLFLHMHFCVFGREEQRRMVTVDKVPHPKRRTKYPRHNSSYYNTFKWSHSRRPPRSAVACLHHYKYKSFEEYTNPNSWRMCRGFTFLQEVINKNHTNFTKKFFAQHNVEDYTLAQYAPHVYEFLQHRP